MTSANTKPTREETIAWIVSNFESRLWRTANDDYQLRLLSRYEVEAIKSALSAPSENAPPYIDRADAVNLARNIRETDNIENVTRKGWLSLVDAVLRMDEYIRALTSAAPQASPSVASADSESGSAAEPAAAAPHAPVMEYDGAFKCARCGASWGALPGNPAMPEVCEPKPSAPSAEAGKPDRMALQVLIWRTGELIALLEGRYTTPTSERVIQETREAIAAVKPILDGESLPSSGAVALAWAVESQHSGDVNVTEVFDDERVAQLYATNNGGIVHPLYKAPSAAPIAPLTGETPITDELCRRLQGNPPVSFTESDAEELATHARQLELKLAEARSDFDIMKRSRDHEHRERLALSANAGMVCPRCGADRLKEPCKQPVGCPMVGEAQ